MSESKVYMDVRRCLTHFAPWDHPNGGMSCVSEVRVAEQPGRWVPWCVEHDEKGSKGSHYCERPIPNSCRWHPMGAFIPETEGGTT